MGLGALLWLVETGSGCACRSFGWCWWAGYLVLTIAGERLELAHAVY
jgi:hypothetical protein